MKTKRELSGYPPNDISTKALSRNVHIYCLQEAAMKIIKTITMEVSPIHVISVHS